MQTPDRESFHELVRRLATIDDSDQAVSPDPLELMNEADRSTSDSINDEHTHTGSSEWIRSPDVSSECFAPETGFVPYFHPAWPKNFEPPFGLDLRPVANLDAQPTGGVDPAQSGVDWQSTQLEIPESAPVSGSDQTPAQDDAVPFKAPSPSVRQHEDARWYASETQPHEIEIHSMPLREPNADRTSAGLTRPVVQPGKSQIESLIRPGASAGDNLDSVMRAAHDARQVIDDLASRVTQLETAQFIRGRL